MLELVLVVLAVAGGGGGGGGGTGVVSGRVSDGRCSGVFGGERRRKRVNNGARVDLWGGDTDGISIYFISKLN